MSEELKLGEWHPGKFLETLLARFFPRIKRKLGLLQADLSHFELQIVDEEHATTTRQSTGQAGRDFQFYPVISVTPDVNGTITVVWDWVNTIDGSDGGRSIPSITNTFTNLTAGVPVQLQLVDNRDPSTGRDPTRNGAIAVGDKDFIAWGKQDGAWHPWATICSVKVTSPSGATKSFQGGMTEFFKSVGALSASMQPFSLTVIT